MAELYIIPECYVDTNLLETLVPTAKGYNHQKGCNNVVKVMKEKLADEFAVGIVDKDKRQIRYVDEFEEVGHTDSLFFYKHPDKAHYLVMISPAVDGFILKCAGDVETDMEQFGFSSDLKSFTEQTKKVSSKEDVTFKNLFQELKNADEVVVLKKALKYLKENKYQSDPEKLKAIIEGI
jgi:hypothetical protein